MIDPKFKSRVVSRHRWNRRNVVATSLIEALFWIRRKRRSFLSNEWSSGGESQITIRVEVHAWTMNLITDWVDELLTSGYDTHTHTHTHTHAHTCTHTYTHMRTHTHMHTLSLFLACTLSSSFFSLSHSLAHCISITTTFQLYDLHFMQPISSYLSLDHTVNEHTVNEHTVNEHTDEQRYTFDCNTVVYIAPPSTPHSISNLNWHEHEHTIWPTLAHTISNWYHFCSLFHLRTHSISLSLCHRHSTCIHTHTRLCAHTHAFMHSLAHKRLIWSCSRASSQR